MRIIAATDRDLAAEVEAGRFREDLYYRLDVDSVRLPPLRERRDDIPALTRFFLERLCAELGVPQPKLDAWDLDPLCSCDWPGNVRELRNVIKRWLLLGRRPGQCVGTGGTPAEGRADTEPGLSERNSVAQSPLRYRRYAAHNPASTDAVKKTDTTNLLRNRS